MKKLLFTALAVVAFSGVAMASTAVVEEIDIENQQIEDSLSVFVKGENPWECLSVFLTRYTGYNRLEYIDDDMALELAREDYYDCRYGETYGIC